MKFTHTNEQLTPNQLNKLISKLTSAIPSFPKLDGKTVSYNYRAHGSLISLHWGSSHHHKTHDNYILDLDENGGIVGITCNLFYEKEHRYKYLSIPLGFVVDSLFVTPNTTQFNRIDLPDDVNTITAHYDDYKRTFMVLLESPSFPDIKTGMQIPEIDYACFSIKNIETVNMED